MFGFRLPRNLGERRGRISRIVFVFVLFFYFYFFFEPFHLYHLNKSKYLSFDVFSAALFSSVGHYGHSHNSAQYEAEPNFHPKHRIDTECHRWQTNVSAKGRPPPNTMDVRRISNERAHCQHNTVSHGTDIRYAPNV